MPQPQRALKPIGRPNLDDEVEKAVLNLMVTHGYTREAAARQVESTLTETAAEINDELIEAGHHAWVEAHPWRALAYALSACWGNMLDGIQKVLQGPQQP